MSDILHVTNGDGAAHRMRAAGIVGEILTWDDVLHEGPVPGGLTAAELREVRADFLASCGWTPRERVAAKLETRDAVLERAGEAHEVVLWFEHDLYDQLQLLQVLDRLCCRSPLPGRVSLVCEAEYLGMMEPARLLELFDARRPVTPVMTGEGRMAWGAFTAPDPGLLESLLRTELPALPFVAPALRRLMEEYPAASNGLSRTERQLLEVLAEGPIALKDAFVRSHHEREPAVFMGDTVFARHVERLARSAKPLVALESGETFDAGLADQGDRVFWTRRLQLTPTGREVLAARADHVKLNGIDRWLGGVHIAGDHPPRWDHETGSLLPGRVP